MKRAPAVVALASIVAVLVLYGVSGFFLVPGLIERHLPVYAAKQLHGSLATGKVRFNPFTLRVSVSDLQLAGSEGAAILTAKQLSADLAWSSLARGTWTFSKIGLERPHLNVERGPDGRVNLASVIRKGEPTDPGAKKPRILVQQISLTQGSLRLADPQLAEIGEKEDLTLDAIDLSLSNLSTLPNRSGAYTADAALASGGSLAWEGDLSLVPFASHGVLTITTLPALSIWKLLRESSPLLRRRASSMRNCPIDSPGKTGRSRSIKGNSTSPVSHSPNWKIRAFHYCATRISRRKVLPWIFSGTKSCFLPSLCVAAG